MSSSSMISVDALTFLHLPGETANPLLVSAGADGRIRIWSAVSTTLLFVLPLSPPPGIYSAPAPAAPSTTTDGSGSSGSGSGAKNAGASLTSLHWHAPTMRLIVADTSGRVGVWDCTKLKKTLTSAANPTPAVIDRIYNAFTPYLPFFFTT